MDAGRVSRSRPFVSTAAKDSRGDVADTTTAAAAAASPKLRSPTTPTLMSPPSAYAANPNTAVPVSSVDASPRLTSMAAAALESVSVMVRLKGGAASSGPQSSINGAMERAATPVNTSTTTVSSSPPPLLLSYAVGEGTFKTPRTGRGRPASHGSGALSPLSHPDTALGSTDLWQSREEHQRTPHRQQQCAPSPPPGSPLGSAEGPQGATLTASPAALAVSLPKALTGAAASGAATPPSGRPLGEGGRTSSIGGGGGGGNNGASVGTVPLHLHTGSTGIGARGRVLSLYSPAAEECRQYEFGEVFEPDTTNTALCERVVPAIMEQLRANYNVCVMCYGQTGSGKTYTMNALVPAVANEVFGTLDVDNEVVEISYVQIYNNKAYNLLEGARGGRLGAELSKPPQATTTESSASSSSSSSSGYGPLEPKALVRSAAEVSAMMRSAARLRVTHAHALNPRSSRSFTLLTLHVTRFLDGAPLTTTRVTLADLAGTERLKKSGATGEGQSQAIFINKSLMALRELVEVGGGEAEVLHYRDSILTTYLAPRMRSWHLFLLVTVSLEVSSFDETKSSLDFATNARRRRIRKVRSRYADRLSGAAGRLHGGGMIGGSNSGGRSSAAVARAEVDVAELQAVVEALHFRVRMLESSLKVAQRQREVLEGLCTPPASPRFADSTIAAAQQPHRNPNAENDDNDSSSSSSGSGGGGSERLRKSDVELAHLRQECRHYRQLLREREDDLRSLQVQMQSYSEGGAAAQLLSPQLDDSAGFFAHGASEQQSDHAVPPALHENGGAGGEEASAAAAAHLRSTPSSLANSISNGGLDTPAALSRAAEDTHGGSAAVSNAAADVADDAHAQLLYGLRQLHSRITPASDMDGALERLYDASLRAKEYADDVRERLLVVTASLRGLRAQNHHLHDRLLRSNRAAVTAEERVRHYRDGWETERVRVCAAATAVDDLRLRLFRALAEQPIIEELTRLYVDEQPAAEAVDTLAGTQLAEHREEMEKLETHQRALQDKITELVNTVEQLSRSGLQKDVSLATLESIITPAQRALFHAMSTTRTSSETVLRQAAGDAHHTSVGGGGESGADCFSLLHSRVSELELLLHQERQQHQATTLELIEAREDARRSRQEQRQAFYQQQEEERRVAQLSGENFDLRQRSERHQLYLDQVHVYFQEQLLELRRYHVVEMAEQRRLLEEAHQAQEQIAADNEYATHRDAERELDGEEDEEAEAAAVAATDDDGAAARVFRQTSTRRGTSHGPQRTSHDWTVEGTARGWGSGTPSPHLRLETELDEGRQSGTNAASAAATRALQPPHRQKVDEKAGSIVRHAAAPRVKGRRPSRTHAKKKTRGKSAAATAAGRVRQGKGTAAASPISHASTGTHAYTEGRRPLVVLSSTQPPATSSRPAVERGGVSGAPGKDGVHTGHRVFS